MSTGGAEAVPEQLCYIPCNFCNIVLAVSVPCSNLFDIVTVRCGHCTNLWSVNMAAAFQSLSWEDVQVLSAAQPRVLGLPNSFSQQLSIWVLFNFFLSLWFLTNSVTSMLLLFCSRNIISSLPLSVNSRQLWYTFSISFFSHWAAIKLFIKLSFEM
ncbi:uncharacterized protein LOC127793954 isoform X2 [Diospyros lotus]|uniref:uncharacterized protein LOC127793954 isoform X2 n=1 Tax=Diospyros lotus TaxID=55363 RepID=UPI00225724D2|nr:uncharacterized protein LOC127793954 isoform X2 [Diospyros lotus]